MHQYDLTDEDFPPTGPLGMMACAIGLIICGLAFASIRSCYHESEPAKAITVQLSDEQFKQFIEAVQHE